MVIWDHLLSLLGLKRGSGPRYYKLDEPLQTMLETIAVQEQRPAEDIQADLIEAGLAQRQTYNELWQRWQNLAAREHDMIAFTCLGFTNRQIAARLDIGPDTVNWYIRRLLVKLNLHSKYELKLQFEGWDFSSWGDKTTK